MVFCGDTSPAKVIEAFDLLKQGAKSQIIMKGLGFRNACAVLYRFRLVELTSAGEYRVPENVVGSSSIKAVWEETIKEESIRLVMDLLTKNPHLPAKRIGEHVATKFKRDWKHASCQRIGNSLRQWTGWLRTSGDDGTIPPPPGRKTLKHDAQPGLFGLGNE